MSHERSKSIESTCTVLSCTSEEFYEFYDNEKYSTDILADEALVNVVNSNAELLHSASQPYRLGQLLAGMLEHAPDQRGKRYVAVALHIAHGKGTDAVVAVAKAWLEHLFLPMLAISKSIKSEPSGSQTPTIDNTAEHIEPASRSDQKDLRKQVAIRELYYCAITKAFDVARVDTLSNQERFSEIPASPQHRMEAAHIIPYLLNDFSSTAIGGHEIRDAARTWDMLHSWTQIDIKALAGSKINSPANAIYMMADDHVAFGRFRFYLDKAGYPNSPNKYKARLTRRGYTLSNGQFSADVEFRTLQESGVEPPNPEFLRVHAAFAKVLSLAGAAEYFERVEREAKENMTLSMNGETDFGLILMSKFALMAH